MYYRLNAQTYIFTVDSFIYVQLEQKRRNQTLKVEPILIRRKQRKYSL